MDTNRLHHRMRLLAITSLCAASMAAGVWAADADARGEMTRAEPSRPGTTAGAPDIQRAHQIVGMTVQSPGGERLGKVDDIVLNLAQERVAYAVVSVGGVLGVGDRTITVPWSAFQGTETVDGKRVLLLDMTRDQLQRAPAFDRDRLSAAAGQRGVSGTYGDWDRAQQAEIQNKQREEMRRWQELQAQRPWDQDYQRPEITRPAPAAGVRRGDQAQDQAYPYVGGAGGTQLEPWQPGYQPRYNNARDELEYRRERERLQLQRQNTERRQQQGVPGMTEEQFNQIYGPERGATSRDAGPARERDNYAAQQDRSADRSPASSRERDNYAAQQDRTADRAPAPDREMTAPRVMPVRLLSHLVGTNVQDAHNQTIGDIEDVAIDMRTGRIVYAIVSFNRIVQPLDGKWAAVPWNAAQFTPRRNAVRLDTDPMALQPITFAAGQVPDLNDPTFARRVYQSFGMQPSTEIYGFVGNEPAPAPGAARGDDEITRQFNPQSITTLTGAVQSIGTFEPQMGGGERLRLQVRTEDNRMVVVYAGPRAYAAAQHLSFAPGDTVTITGSKATLNGREVIIATEVRKGDQTLRLRDPQGRPVWETQPMQPTTRPGASTPAPSSGHTETPAD